MNQLHEFLSGLLDAAAGVLATVLLMALGLLKAKHCGACLSLKGIGHICGRLGYCARRVL